MNQRCQEDVWACAFGKDHLDVNPEERSLLVTEPLFAPRSVQEEHDELVFETFGFRAHYRCCAPLLAALNFKNDFPTSQFAHSPAHLVVDAGYSFTHAVPCFDFHALNYAVKRVNVGGLRPDHTLLICALWAISRLTHPHTHTLSLSLSLACAGSSRSMFGDTGSPLAFSRSPCS